MSKVREFFKSKKTPGHTDSSGNDWTKQDDKLLHVVEKGDVVKVTALISGKKAVTCTKPDSRGITAFHLAASLGFTGMVDAFLSSGADVQALDGEGDTILHSAAGNGHTSVVNKLLQAGVPVFLPNAKKRSALHKACENGHLDCVVALVLAGSPVHAQDKDQWNPLFFAAVHGYADIVAYLLDNGAKINEQDNENRTALMLATEGHHLRTCQLLIKRGANVKIKDSLGRTAASIATDHEFNDIKACIDNAPSIAAWDLGSTENYDVSATISEAPKKNFETLNDQIEYVASFDEDSTQQKSPRRKQLPAPLPPQYSEPRIADVVVSPVIDRDAWSSEDSDATDETSAIAMTTNESINLNSISEEQYETIVNELEEENEILNEEFTLMGKDMKKLQIRNMELQKALESNATFIKAKDMKVHHLETELETQKELIRDLKHQLNMEKHQNNKTVDTDSWPEDSEDENVSEKQTAYLDKRLIAVLRSQIHTLQRENDQLQQTFQKYGINAEEINSLQIPADNIALKKWSTFLEKENVRIMERMNKEKAPCAGNSSQNMLMLEYESSQLKSNKTQLEVDLEQCNAKLEKLSAENVSLEQRIQDIISFQDEQPANMDVIAFFQEINSLKRQNSELQTRNDDLEEELLELKYHKTVGLDNVAVILDQNSVPVVEKLVQNENISQVNNEPQNYSNGETIVEELIVSTEKAAVQNAPPKNEVDINLEKFENTIESLRKENTAYKQDIEELLEYKNELENHAGHLQLVINNNETELSSLETNRKQLVNDVKSIQKQLETSEKQKTKLQKQIKKMVRTRDEEKNAEMKKQEQLLEELEVIDYENKQLLAQLSDVKTDQGHDDEKNESKSLSDENQKLLGDIELLKDEVRKLKSNGITEEKGATLQKAQDSLDFDIKSRVQLGTENDILQKELEDAESLVEKLTMDKDELERQIEGMTSKYETRLKEEREKVKEAKKQMKILKKEKTSVDEEIEVMKNLMEVLQRENSEYIEQLSEFNDEKSKTLEYSENSEMIVRELEGKLSASNEERAELENEVTSLMQKCDELLDGKEQLENELEELRGKNTDGKIETNNDEVSYLKKRISELEEDRIQQLRRIDEFADCNEANFNEVRDLVEELGNCKMENSELQMEKEDLERDLAEADAQVEELYDKKMLLESEMIEKNARIDELEKSSDNLADRVSQLNDSCIEFEKSKIETEAKLIVLKKKISKLEEEKLNATQRMLVDSGSENTKIANINLRKDLTEKNSKIQKLEENCKILHQQVNKLKDDYAAATSAKRVLQNELENLQTEKEDLEKDRSMFVKDAEVKLELSGVQIEKAELENSNLLEEIKTYNRRIDELEKTREGLESKVKAVEERNDALDEELEEKYSEIQKLKEANNILENDRRDHVEGIQTQLLFSDGQREQLIDENKNLRNEMMIGKNKIELLEREKEDSFERSSRLTEEISEMKVSNANLKQEIEKLKIISFDFEAEKGTRDALLKDHSQLQVQYENLRDEFTQLELNKQTAEIEAKQLKTIINELESENDVIISEKSDLQKQIENLDDECTELQTKNLTLKEEIRNLVSTNEKLDEEKKKYVNELTAQFAKVNAECTQLKSSNKSLKKEVTSLKTSNEQLVKSQEEESRLLTEQLQKLNVEYSELNMKNEQLLEKVDDLNKVDDDIEVITMENVQNVSAQIPRMEEENEELQALRMECEDLQRLNSELQQRAQNYNDVQDDMFDLQEENDQLQANNEKISTELSSLVKDYDMLQEELDLVKMKLNDQSSNNVDITVTNGDYKNLEDKVTILNHELVNLQKENEAKEEDKLKLEDEITELTQRMKSLLREKDVLAEEVDALEKINFELEEKKASKDSDRHKSELDKLENERTALEQENRDLQEYVDKAQREILELRQLAGNSQEIPLRDSSKVFDKKEEEYIEEIKQLNEKLNSLEDYCQKVEESGDGLVQQSDELIEQLEQFQLKCEELERGNSELSEKYAKLELLNRDIREQNTELLHKLNSECNNNRSLSMDIVTAELVSRTAQSPTFISMESSAYPKDGDSVEKQVQVLQEQLVDHDTKHKEIIDVYRSHLLDAVQGNIKPEVNEALTAIIEIRKKSPDQLDHRVGADF
ncbi:uncharacterized protein LOC141906282 [Tubulanus polymorphus]|uniref:uncharacterized protein LOC141906282 n=1 Tax=Tubulanus polymorphus TaxID=672921 RepID=UPI003DA3C600